MASHGARQKAEARGRRAEIAASVMLMLKGYRIVARRARTPLGEIDLVAFKGKVLAIVEVKARPTVTACLEAITPTHRARQSRAAIAWITTHQWAQRLVLRFDVVAVLPGHLPKHFRDAWRPEHDVLRGWS